MLAILPVLLWLGTWQLQRADIKRVMLEQFETGGVPVELQEYLDLDPLELRYRPVRVEGRYLTDRQFLLEGMSKEGRPGLHVLTPLSLENGGVVIVDRGWIPETRTRQTNPNPDVGTGLRSVTGRVVPFPAAGLKLSGEPGTAWPRRVVYPTHTELAAQLDLRVYPHMIWLDASDPAGYERDWKPAEFGPARHIGYAVQWFALAVTLVLIYIILKFRRKHD